MQKGLKREFDIMLKIKRIIVLLFLSMAFSGCDPLLYYALTPSISPGLHTRMNSTAPSFGPIFLGITREDAERHLGNPLLTMTLDDKHYINTYEYELERSVKETLATDLLDVATFGLGIYIVSPIDRFDGTKHLISITYMIEDQHERNDRIMAVTDRLRNNPLAIYWSEKSYESIQKGEWEEGIKSASLAASLDSQLSSSYMNRGWAYYEKGLYDKAIQDYNKVLEIDPKSALAYNQRGLAYQKKGLLDKAIEDYEQACKLGLETACDNLGRIREEQLLTKLYPNELM